MKKKFAVRNLDCAACAAKIERGLQQTGGIGDVSLDFASLTLHVNTVDFDRVIEAVGRIAPAVELVPRDPGTTRFSPRSAETSDAEHRPHRCVLR